MNQRVPERRTTSTVQPNGLRWFALVASTCMVSLGIVVSPTRAGEADSSRSVFESKVQPILEAKCYRCHGTDVRKADLNLSTAAGIAKGGESGTILDRDHPTKSVLYDYVHERYMPPEGEEQLTDEEVETICRWIEAGVVPSSGEAETPHELNQHDVLPILRLRCAICHGAQRQQADLDIRSRKSLLQGGKSGPAIVPGKPDESLLLKRIRAEEMPPHKDLAKYSVKPVTKAELATLTEWIAAGAPTQEVAPDVATTDPDPLVSDEDRQFWAFQPPVRPPIPAVQGSEFVRTPIDAFILSRLEAAEISLSPEANRRTLIRRVYFDLIGLPPQPEEVEAFVADKSSNAYAQLVDRLLQSPHYGERWGQYWLDAAGYSDSEGVQNADVIRPHAWRYRDYVIRAFNDDKPYDRFLLEQLAGDELADYDNAGEISDVIYDNLVATGFLRMGPDGTYSPITGFVPDRLEVIDDAIEVLGSTVMGLTIKCARCHTHKFDPLPQRDYYRLAAVFKGAFDEHDWLVPQPSGDNQLRLLPYGTPREIADWKAAGEKPESRPMVRALWDRGNPSPTYVLQRGNYLSPGQLVGPGVPSALTDGKTPFDVAPAWPGANKTGRRLAFARWITQPDHPLTARVMVNRIWKHHFQDGLVKTLDNFGTTGTMPTHPELLDWLAVQFVDDGWSIKDMHRVIMTSAVYRQSSQVTEAHEHLDPENELLSRMPLKRMDGEVLRDSLLALAERLDRTQFGPADPLAVRGDGLVTGKAQPGNSQTWRRSIYLTRRRTQPVTILQNFDLPTMNPNCIDRTESIVAPQALHLNNNQLVRELASAFAERVRQDAGDDQLQQIDRAFRLAAGRPPSPEEQDVASRAMSNIVAQWSASNLSTRHELAATAHLWIREIEPDRVFEDDLISVWSQNSSDKGRRYGLVEFDVRELAGLDVIAARLELGALADTPLLQTAAVIPPGIAGCTWNAFQSTKANSLHPLEQLGRYELTSASPPAPGVYVSSPSASEADLATLIERAGADGKFTLVLRADEDGTPYRQDWDDGVHNQTRGNPPRLVVWDSRPDLETPRRRALENLCHALVNSAAFIYID